MKSTSASLGGYFLERLWDGGWETESVHVQSALKSERGTAEMLSAVENAGIVALAFPLYVDGPPAAIIRAMEIIAENGQKAPEKKQALVSIINCGFPEASQNNFAQEMCRIFAKKAGFSWAGGLAMGCGESIHGKSLEKMGAWGQGKRKALRLAAKALANGEQIPEKAAKLMAHPILRPWLLKLLGTLGWKRQGKKNNVGNLGAKPYSRKC
jgi:hypothetical protein